MSHRLTIETQITDPEAAMDALRANKIEFRQQGQVLSLQTYPYQDTSINLKTGLVVSGDSDRVQTDKSQLGLLRGWYAEAKFKIEAAREGIQITDRQETIVNGRKAVVLSWQNG